MGAMQEPGTGLFRKRHLGPHAAARNSVARALHPGRPRPDSPAAEPSTDSIHTHVEFWQQLCRLCRCGPQLVCYSWMTGINEVAQVVFVRKRMVEVQYLRATITEEQRQEFETLVDDTVRRIESGLFLPHSGIRFPQNPCTTCPFL